MMQWIPRILKWSGLFLTPDECYRQLPNGKLGCGQIKSMTLVKSCSRKKKQVHRLKECREKVKRGMGTESKLGQSHSDHRVYLYF